jgi:hypothetical protein
MTRADWAQEHFGQAANLMAPQPGDDRAWTTKAALWHREQARRLEAPHEPAATPPAAPPDLVPFWDYAVDDYRMAEWRTP